MDKLLIDQWPVLTTVDYCLLAIIGFSGIVSLFRGFVREILSLITWVLAVWLALHFSDFFVTYLEGYVHSASMRLMISILLVVVITLTLGMVVSQLVMCLVKFTGLSSLDRFFGFFFGVLRGALIVVLLLILASTIHFDEKVWWKKAWVIEQFAPAVVWGQQWLPNHLGQVAELIWPTSLPHVLSSDHLAAAHSV